MNDGVMLARPAPGTVGETQRKCHVFPIPEGPAPDRLAALCGASFGHGELERLDGPSGMPCERCLSRVPLDSNSEPRQLNSEPPTSSAGGSVTQRLDLIERTLDQVQWHLDTLRTAVTAILEDPRRNGR